MKEAPEDIFAMTSSIENSPDSPQEVEIIFKNGFPVGINDESLTPVEIIKKANVLAGEHGFGRIDMIEEIVEKKWGQLVYQGFWFGPLKDSLDSFISSTQTAVNGRVKIRLHKGNAIVIGRMSENNSLYREDLATYSKDDVFNHSLAEGFIYMWGMSNKIWAELNSKTKD